MFSIKVNLIRVYDLLHRSVPNFDGIYYRHTNIELATYLLKENYNIILSTDTILVGVLSLGFEAISSIALNLFPENITEIYDLVLNAKLREAREVNDKLYRKIKDVVTLEKTDWVESMKLEFNKKVDFKIGEVRKPRTTTNLWNKKY